MSMVTRCPHCATAFRITSAALKSHRGLVRCGHCSEVFNAFDSLSTTHAAQGETVPDREEAAQASPVSFAGAQVDIPLRKAPAEEPVRELTAQFSEDSVGEDEADEKELMYVREVMEEPFPERTVQEAEEALDLPARQALAEAAEKEEGAVQEVAEAPLPEAPAEEFFVGEPPSRFGWAWISGAAVLFIALLAQAAYFWRMEASLAMPGSRPYLEAYCRVLGCAIPLPRQVDLVGIESSSLQAEPSRVGVIDLHASIRNSASFAQAYPLIELTLTDAQDAPLARKIFKPAEYLARDAAIGEGIPANAAVNARLYLDTGTLLPSGYRLYLFYP